MLGSTRINFPFPNYVVFFIQLRGADANFFPCWFSIPAIPGREWKAPTWVEFSFFFYRSEVILVSCLLVAWRVLLLSRLFFLVSSFFSFCYFFKFLFQSSFYSRSFLLFFQKHKCEIRIMNYNIIKGSFTNHLLSVPSVSDACLVPSRQQHRHVYPTLPRAPQQDPCSWLDQHWTAFLPGWGMYGLWYHLRKTSFLSFMINSVCR